MKKSLLFLTSIISLPVFFASCNKNQPKNEVVIYTYDSFMSEWGPAEQIASDFKAKTGLTATFIDCGDGVQVLSRAILEKEHPVADIILGIDNNLSQQALDADILEDYIPENADKIINPAIQAQLSTGSKLVPYDYSHFAMIFNTQSNLPEPQKLSDLTDPVYSKKIILMDPRTSTPGLGFVAWTKAVFTDDKEFNDFWQALKPNILTMANGWSAGYALFTAGEAPLVISYTTSPAANLEYDKIDYYKALIFEDGHYMQVEGAGILKNAPNKKGAKLFMDFLISDKAQNALPLTQWMYPVNQNVVMPECYAKAGVIPEKTVTLDSSLLKEAVETVISIVK